MKKAGESRTERRAEEPRDRPTERTLAKRSEKTSRNSPGASQEHTSETGQHGESKAVDLLEGTERWEASPHPGEIQCRGAE